MSKIGSFLRSVLVYSLLSFSSFVVADDPTQSPAMRSPLTARELAEITQELQDQEILREVRNLFAAERIQKKLASYTQRNGLTPDFYRYTVCLRKLKVNDDLDFGFAGAGDFVPSAIFLRPETVLRIPSELSKLKFEAQIENEAIEQTLTFPGGIGASVKTNMVKGEEACFIVNKGKTFIDAHSGAWWEDKSPAGRGKHSILIPTMSQLSSGKVLFDFKLEEWDEDKGEGAASIPADKNWVPVALSVDPRDFVEGPPEARTYRTSVSYPSVGVEAEFEVTQTRESFVKILKVIGELETINFHFERYVEVLELSRLETIVRPKNGRRSFVQFYEFAETLDRLSDFLQLPGKKEIIKQHALFLAKNVAPKIIEMAKNQMLTYEELRDMQKIFDAAELDSRDLMVFHYRRLFFELFRKATVSVDEFSVHENLIFKAAGNIGKLSDDEITFLRAKRTVAETAVTDLRRAAALVGVGSSATVADYRTILYELRTGFENKMAPKAVRLPKQ